jgi:hypothetical protein
MLENISDPRYFLMIDETINHAWVLALTRKDFTNGNDICCPVITRFATYFLSICCDVVVAQINYPSFKHNTQDSIEQARGRSHRKIQVRFLC